MQRRPQRREPEVLGQMLDRDGAVRYSALPIEQFVAAALQRQHLEWIAQADGRRFDRHVQYIVGCCSGIADVGQTVAEDEQRRGGRCRLECRGRRGRSSGWRCRADRR
jgi:hypothetical protein